MVINEPISRPDSQTADGKQLSAFVRNNLRATLWWACTIIASLIAFPLTEGTPYQQLAVGLLMSSSTLFVLIAVFECLVWLLDERSC
jgi:hypothetical protein